MENDFYNRIIYKKNAFLELKDYLKYNYDGKKVLIISTKDMVNNHLTEIMNCVSLSSCTFKHFISKNNFSNYELKQLCEMLTLENFDVYIVYGEDKAVMVAKYFANIFCVPYIVCPSSCGCLACFSNVCVNPYDCTRSFNCEFPDKIFISESVVKTSSLDSIKQSVYFILSLEEMLAMSSFENILFDKQIDCSQIIKNILKLQKELKSIMSGDSEAKLILMDIVIDTTYELEKVNMFEWSTFNLYTLMKKIFLNSNNYSSNGEIVLLSSKILLLCYKNLFLQKKIKQLEFPNFSKIIKNIQKNDIFCKKINNFQYFNSILSKKELLTRLNNLKEEFLYQCNKRIDEQDQMLNIIKSYDDIFTHETPKLSDVFSAVNVLPFVCDNNYIVELIGGIGLANSF